MRISKELMDYIAYQKKYYDREIILYSEAITTHGVAIDTLLPLRDCIENAINNGLESVIGVNDSIKHCDKCMKSENCSPSNRDECIEERFSMFIDEGLSSLLVEIIERPGQLPIIALFNPTECV